MFLNIRVKQEMDDRDMKMADLVRRTKFSQSFISRIMSFNKALSEKTTLKILTRGFDLKHSEAKAKIAQWRIEEYGKDVDLDELMYHIGAKKLDLGTDYINIPVYGSISCGVAGRTDIIGDLSVSVKNLDKSKEYYALNANGDSMSPEIPNGAQVIIEKTHEYRGPSSIYVFKIGVDELGLGRLVRSDDRWEITKSNKTYPPIPMKGEDSLEVCGIVAQITYKP